MRKNQSAGWSQPVRNRKCGSLRAAGRPYQHLTSRRWRLEVSAPGSVSSGKRVNARTLEITDKVKGEIMDHTTYEVSPDGKTLTLTIRETGQPKALTVVYDKM